MLATARPSCMFRSRSKVHIWYHRLWNSRTEKSRTRQRSARTACAFASRDHGPRAGQPSRSRCDIEYLMSVVGRDYGRGRRGGHRDAGVDAGVPRATQRRQASVVPAPVWRRRHTVARRDAAGTRAGRHREESVVRQPAAATLAADVVRPAPQLQRRVSHTHSSYV